MSDPIKQGDAVTLAWDLSPAPAAGSTATVVISELRTTPIVSRVGVITDARVSIALTPSETAAVGTYFVEIQISPGPHTYPSSGHDKLVIAEKLA